MATESADQPFADQPLADQPLADLIEPADWLADRLPTTDSPQWRQIEAVLRQLGALDRAVYQAIATVPTPALDEPLRRLSRAADNSKLWLAIAAVP